MGSNVIRMESCTISKSNAIILSNNKQTVGIGAGQMNRVGAAKIALEELLKSMIMWR